MNGNAMTKDALLRKIQELSFAKVECELFLDTHPDCRQALDYYHRLIDELGAYVMEYENAYGPLTAAASIGDKWTWVDGPWPWQLSEKGEKK